MLLLVGCTSPRNLEPEPSAGADGGGGSTAVDGPRGGSPARDDAGGAAVDAGTAPRGPDAGGAPVDAAATPAGAPDGPLAPSADAGCDGSFCSVVCPAGQRVCYGRCVDLLTDGEHCGSCDHACPAGCGAGTCRCVQASGANLVRNAGFATSADGWGVRAAMEPPTVSWVGDDAAGCAGSGAVSLRTHNLATSATDNLTQCVRVTPGTIYNVGGSIREAGMPGPGATFASIWVEFYRSATCDGDTGLSSYPLDSGLIGQQWRHASRKLEAPPGATGALLLLGVTGTNSASFDMVYLTPYPGGF
jgi:hypothetical protein